jgi:O-antigen/teichoic acid export membrane protein
LSATLRSETSQRRLRILAVYTTGQGLAQLLNLLIGFLLLRWLNISNYAQFSVAFGFQVTMGLLTDLGFAGTIIALVGPRGNDPNVVGSYIRSGRHLRNLMIVWLTPVAAIAYIGIVRQHHWDARSSTLLFLSIVASIYFSGMVSYYAAPLLIHGRLTDYYRHQLAGASTRIVICGALYFTGGLNAWTTSWVNAIGLLLIGWLNARESRPFITLPVHPDPAVTRQMVHYVLPNLPSLIFFALQGQISLFLISFFGQTRSIAEVGALGRLGQIFLLLSGFNGAVVEPFMARLPKERVLRSFLTILVAASAICVVICLAGFLEPREFLLLLGAKYASLQRETGWLVLGSCMGYLVGVVWTMTAARQWIYWATSWVAIGLILTTQIVFLCLCRVDSTLHVIWFGVATSAAYLIAVLFNTVYGFIRGPRIQIPEATVSEHLVEEITRAEQI